MELRKYDGKCIRLRDVWGEEIEGICSYNCAEYCEHEFGRCEDALQIESFLFYRGDIESIESLEERDGPYGRFSAAYGRLEELILEEGEYAVEDTLLSEEPEHSLRLMSCIEARLGKGESFGYLAMLLRDTARNAESHIVREKAKKLLSVIS